MKLLKYLIVSTALILRTYFFNKTDARQMKRSEKNCQNKAAQQLHCERAYQLHCVAHKLYVNFFPSKRSVTIFLHFQKPKEIKGWLHFVLLILLFSFLAGCCQGKFNGKEEVNMDYGDFKFDQKSAVKKLNIDS